MVSRIRWASGPCPSRYSQDVSIRSGRHLNSVPLNSDAVPLNPASCLWAAYHMGLRLGSRGRIKILKNETAARGSEMATAVGTETKTQTEAEEGRRRNYHPVWTHSLCTTLKCMTLARHRAKPNPVRFYIFKGANGVGCPRPIFVGKNDARAQRQDARSVPAGSGGPFF